MEYNFNRFEHVKAQLERNRRTSIQFGAKYPCTQEVMQLTR